MSKLRRGNFFRAATYSVQGIHIHKFRTFS